MATINETQESLAFEEILRNGARRPRINLALQEIQIRIRGQRRRMGFRIGTHTDLKIPNPLQTPHQILGLRIPPRMRHIF